MMITKFERTQLDKDASTEHIEKYGGYNHKPPNWRELTEEEFARSDFFTYGPTQMEFRQFSDPEHNNGYKGAQSVFLFYVHAGHGYGIYSSYGQEMFVGSRQKRLRIFRFGCEHTYKELDQKECRELKVPHFGRCYHVLQCTKCGYIYSYDSSD